MNRAPRIAVYGSSSVAPQSPVYAEALLLGRLLAQHGAEVACGGYGGVMEAVSRGAREAGGRAVGYTVASWDDRRANTYLSEQFPCRDLYERLRHLIDECDAMLALGGGIGTLVEVTLAWNQLFMDLIEPRPLIVVGEAWRQVLDRLSTFLEVGARHLAFVRHTDDAQGALTILSDEGIFS